MFVFKIKDNRIAIESMLIRALLALGAIITLVYRTGDDFTLNIGDEIRISIDGIGTLNNIVTQ